MIEVVDAIRDAASIRARSQGPQIDQAVIVRWEPAPGAGGWAVTAPVTKDASRSLDIDHARARRRNLALVPRSAGAGWQRS